jgi:hypothetical protein
MRIALGSYAQGEKTKEMDAKLVNKDAVPGPHHFIHRYCNSIATCILMSRVTLTHGKSKRSN